MEVRDNSSSNPLIIVSSEEVSAWLRSKADEAGYGDRAMCAVQVTVERPFATSVTHHMECPTLVIMVSNIKGDRAAASPTDQPLPPSST